MESENGRPIICPIVTSCNFLCDPEDTKPKYAYSRDGNPSRDNLESNLAKLEGAKYGLGFSSGMTAIMALSQAFLKSGDHILCSNQVFVGTSRCIRKGTSRMKFKLNFFDALNVTDLAHKITSDTKMIFIEILTNPLLEVINIDDVLAVTKDFPEIILVVDNTLLTPYLMRPLKKGVNIVFHSVTKFLNGLGDVTMGAILTNERRIFEPLQFVQTNMGLVPSPFDCYLVCRSLRTFELRMQRHCENALKVARFLSEHKSVSKVIYPGLDNHPQHLHASHQFSNGGFGAVVSFFLKAEANSIHEFIRRLTTIKSSWGVGQSDTIIYYPWPWVQEPPEELFPEGEAPVNAVTEQFVRLSVGLECIHDIIMDLKLSLDQIII